MKAIFLDIDGVLNDSNTIKRVKESGKRIKINEEMLKRLVKIVKETNAKIVLSSTWRGFFDKQNNKIIPIYEEGYLLENLFQKHDLHFFDITPFDENRNRTKEINIYLNNHPEIEDFIIIDDETFEDPNLTCKHIKTFYFGDEDKTGLCDYHVSLAITMLNQDKKLKTSL